jgi:hypothetical protein
MLKATQVLLDAPIGITDKVPDRARPPHGVQPGEDGEIPT